MWFFKCFSPQYSANYMLRRFLRKVVSFLRYEVPELLLILLCVAIIMLIWEYFFWR